MIVFFAFLLLKRLGSLSVPPATLAEAARAASTLLFSFFLDLMETGGLEGFSLFKTTLDGGNMSTKKGPDFQAKVYIKKYLKHWYRNSLISLQNALLRKKICLILTVSLLESNC